MNDRPASVKAQSILDSLVRASKVPGIQYLVLDPHRTVFEFSGGWADIANQRPMNFAATLMAYSMSKTITAAAVLQLVQAGELKLDDTIDRYIDWHPYGPGITIRQLISHTSGIPNPIPLAWVHSPVDHDRFDEHAELASVLRKHSKLAFPPGTKFKYSNIGYWLLGPIVERVSGEAFTTFVRKNILAPLDIAAEELEYGIPDRINHAKGYLEKYSLMNVIKRFVIASKWVGHYEGRWLQIYDHFLNGPPFGGLVGTARGFGKFLQDQLRPHSKILDDPTRELFYAPQQTSRGLTIPMSLGWHIKTLSGRPCFYKEGGGGGFHCMMRLYPESEMASVMMTNATMFDVRAWMDAVDPLFDTGEKETR
jgi:CubicO group peptidase (beta-lactamase class C family)